MKAIVAPCRYGTAADARPALMAGLASVEVALELFGCSNAVVEDRHVDGVARDPLRPRSDR